MRIYEGTIGDNMQMTGVKNFSGLINTGTGPLTIGRRSNSNTEYMIGEIARVFIDDHSITDESINNGDLPSSSDLVLDYNNFASIPTLTDVSGNNNNGTTGCTIKSIESLVDGSELQLSFNRSPMRQIGQSFKTMQKGHLKEVVLKIGDQGNLQGGELRVDLYQLDVNSSTKYSYWTFIESSNTIGYKKGVENVVNFSGNSRIKANNYYILVVRSANFFPLAGSNQNPFKEGDAFYIDEQSMTSKGKIERTELKVDNTFDLYFRAVLK
ncbi:MAG: hypothetical protein JKY03_01275 [Aureispira sp.]|nr:hypothetical protein [Aureispira sp.]